MVPFGYRPWTCPLTEGPLTEGSLYMKLKSCPVYLLGSSSSSFPDDSNFGDQDEGPLVGLSVDTAEVVDGHGQAVLHAELLKLADWVAAGLKANKYTPAKD